ncbi:hypothetical protein Dsin_000697 [Dipteronia sinensis]|uniref:Retrotransposon gag domain-containing protein n=1 Tax=Dipteronia sinensis TaxID=43782 RepID=A0AAE0EHR7_9ROSI|nr:hypothetical protein Dsin_000697 [Dipteronia sinensis]
MNGRRSVDTPPIEQDPEIERTLHQLRRNQERNMDEEIPPNQAVVQALDQPSCIILPPNINFEIKSSTIHLLPTFYGKSAEDPHIHIKEFFAVCTTITNGGENDEGIRLRLFPFSLKDKAKEWLHSLPSGSIASWVDLAAKFLSKFFRAQRTNKIQKEIMGCSNSMETRQSIKNIENQIGHIASSLSQRDQGRLPSQVIQNSKGNQESTKAITLRSGKEVGQGKEEMDVDMEAKEKKKKSLKRTDNKRRRKQWLRNQVLKS